MKMNLSVVLGMVDKASAPLKKVSGEYGHFTPRVEKAQKALHATTNAMANISAHQKNQKALKANGDQIAATKERIEKYQKQIKSGKPLTAAQTAQFNKQKEKLKDLNATQQAYKDELSRVGKQLKKAGVNTKNLAAEEKRLGTQYDRNKTKLDAMQRKYKNLNSVMNAAKGHAKKVGVGIAAGFGVISAASAGVFSMVNSTAEEMDKLTKTAQNMKVPLSMLQSLQFQSEHAGVAADTMGNAMIRFTKRFGMLQSTGAGALGSFLKKSKNPFYEELKGAENVEQGYNKLLVAFSNLKNEQEEMAFADAAFGQDGRRMLLMLRQGTKGLSDSRKELMSLGAMIDDNDTAKAEAYNDALFDIKLALNAMKIKVLTPIMKQLTGTFIELIKNFKKADWREDAIKQVTEGIQALFTATKTVFKAFVTLVNYFPEIVAGLALVKTGFFALNAVMLANPVGWIVAAIAGLVIALVYLVTRWKEVKDIIKVVWDAFKSLGRSIMDFSDRARASFKSIFNSTVSFLIQPLKMFFGLLAKVPKSLLPDGWSKGLDELNSKIQSFDAKLRESAKTQMAFAESQSKTMRQHFDEIRHARAVAEQTIKLERSNEPLIDLAGEFKNNGGQTPSIIKSPQVTSSANMHLTIKSDKPVEIDSLETKGNTDFSVDTGGLLSMGF